MKTIYLVYAKLPDLTYKWSSFYLPYIKKTFVMSNDHENWIGLYAWTNNKEIMKNFKKTRKTQIYIYKEKTVEKKYLKKFRKENRDSELGEYKYIQSDILKCLPDIDVVTTLGEYHAITDDETIYSEIEESSVFMNYDVDYIIFKDNIIMSLDILNYTTEYDLRLGLEDRPDTAGYLMGYAQTVFGNKYISIYENQFALLMNIFGFLFLGE